MFNRYQNTDDKLKPALKPSKEEEPQPRKVSKGDVSSDIPNVEMTMESSCIFSGVPVSS